MIPEVSPSLPASRALRSSAEWFRCADGFRRALKGCCTRIALCEELAASQTGSSGPERAQAAR